MGTRGGGLALASGVVFGAAGLEAPGASRSHGTGRSVWERAFEAARVVLTRAGCLPGGSTSRAPYVPRPGQAPVRGPPGCTTGGPVLAAGQNLVAGCGLRPGASSKPRSSVGAFGRPPSCGGSRRSAQNVPRKPACVVIRTYGSFAPLGRERQDVRRRTSCGVAKVVLRKP